VRGKNAGRFKPKGRTMGDHFPLVSHLLHESVQPGAQNRKTDQDHKDILDHIPNLRAKGNRDTDVIADACIPVSPMSSLVYTSTE
jgi:hypothetical protein